MWEPSRGRNTRPWRGWPRNSPRTARNNRPPSNGEGGDQVEDEHDVIQVAEPAEPPQGLERRDQPLRGPSKSGAPES